MDLEPYKHFAETVSHLEGLDNIGNPLYCDKKHYVLPKYLPVPSIHALKCDRATELY